MRRSFAGIAIGVLLILATASVALVAAETEYGLTVTDAIDTPAETITIEGSEFEIDHVGAVDPGETVTVEVRSGKNYHLYLYNADGQSEFHEYNGASEDTVDIDTASIPAGTYMLSLEPEGEGRQAVAPVVVQGYDITLEYSKTASIDEEIEFTATVEPTADVDDPEGVDVAIWDGDGATEFSLQQTGDGTYEGSIPAADLGEGEYRAYAAVMGGDEVDNYETALAIENGATITVTEDDDSDGSDGGGGESGDDGNESGGEGSDDDGTDGNESDDVSGNESAGSADDATDGEDDADETEDDSGETGDSDSGDADGDGEQSDDAGENDAAEGDDSVLQPTDDGSDDTDTDGDALGTGGTVVLALVLAVLGLAHVARRQY